MTENMESLRDKQADGNPDKSMPGIKDTLPPGMSAPSAPGEAHMGGVHKGNDAHIGNSGMGSAVSLLNEQTERGLHAATVAGMKVDKFR